MNELRCLSSGHHSITVERARSDFRSLLAGAALSISQAGYNTMMDLLIANCPAVVVPFSSGGENEQILRAREFERRGLLSVIEEVDLSPARLLAVAKKQQSRHPT